MTMLQVSITGLILTPLTEISEYFGYSESEYNRNISKSGKLAITKSGENCFPWEEVMDSQIGFDFYGRRTTSFIKRYRLLFEPSKILSNPCH